MNIRIVLLCLALVFRFPIMKAYSAFLSDDELHHVRRSITENGTCDEDKIIEQLVNVRVTTPESIITLSLLEGQALCSKLLQTVGILNDYLKTCVISPKNLYMKLISGLRRLDEMLCYDAAYFQKFEVYYYCIHEIENEFDVCAGPLDWNEEHNHKKVCKIYRKMVDCYYIKVAQVCSLEGAKVFKQMITTVIDEVINCPCDVKSDPEVKDAMPDQYIQKSIGYAVANTAEYWTIFITVIAGVVYI
ncbi:uncharacterized protein LOC109604328 isoform X2 [Aethina tumida]|uniref:uncharacterized protein LOC109604328 isoform X2 n=1 Tax=Aethina tumida TaxID=116153 RepID=UPI0021486A98|nr:uncharacterized protein LOC109604328 isoform X2 [Aethina tumida]